MSLVVDHLRGFLEYFEAVHSRTIVNDHYLILGWTDKTSFLIAELMAMLEEEGGIIVILGEPDRLEVAMGGKSFSSRPVCFVWRITNKVY